MNTNNLASKRNTGQIQQDEAVHRRKWLSRKNEHLELSAAAADTYDEVYTKSSFAASVYMRYEMEIMEEFIAQTPDHILALDLGCGTGRASVLLSEHFRFVKGYDFSPEMVRVANDNLVNLYGQVENISFEVLDIEDQSLPVPDEAVDFVNTAFGMGSFVRDTDKLISEVYRVLKPGGIAIFSFYNSKSLINQLSLDWQPAMIVRSIEGEDALEVRFADHIYTIAARSFTVHEVTSKLKNGFDKGVLDIMTFPTLSAFFPQSLFEDPKTQQLCNELDRLIATNLEIAAGSYIIAVCRKAKD